MVSGFCLLLLPFLMSGMGAGDVKGFAALGALIGPSAIFQTFLYTALIGGVISLVYIVITCNIREKARAGVLALGAFAASRDPRCFAPGSPKKKYKFPYAPAMLLGYLAYLAWGNLV
jgi:prepilin peptidase CpaA